MCKHCGGAQKNKPSIVRPVLRFHDDLEQDVDLDARQRTHPIYPSASRSVSRVEKVSDTPPAMSTHMQYVVAGSAAVGAAAATMVGFRFAGRHAPLGVSAGAAILGGYLAYTQPDLQAQVAPMAYALYASSAVVFYRDFAQPPWKKSTTLLIAIGAGAAGYLMQSKDVTPASLTPPK